jgi:hypothetical protein
MNFKPPQTDKLNVSPIDVPGRARPRPGHIDISKTLDYHESSSHFNQPKGGPVFEHAKH